MNNQTNAQLISSIAKLKKRIFELEQNHTEHQELTALLETSQSFNEALIHSSQDIIYIYDIIDQKNIYTNDGIETVLGYTPAEIKVMGNTMLSTLMHPDDLSHYLTSIIPSYQSLQGNEVIEHEYRIKHKNGNWRWLHAKEQVYLRNSDQSPRQIFGINSDITEQKQVKEAVQEGLEHFRMVMQQSPNVIEIYNSDGLQIDVNKAYEELWGFSASLTINKFNVLESDEVKETGLITYVNRAYAGESVTIPEYHFDPTGATEAQGEGRVRWLSTRIYPLKDIAGKVTNVVITHEDVTDRKAAEKALLENTANMTAIMENTQDSIWTINTGYEIVYVNSIFKAAFMASFGVELGPGVNLLDSLPAPLKPLWQSRYDRALKNEQFEVVDAIDVGVHMIYIEASLNPILVNGVVVGVSLFGRDVTARKQAEQDKLNFEKQLLQTQKLESLGVLAGGIAHDFNNILMGILGYADLALSSLDSIAPAREFVQGINDSTRKAAGLVKQMLAYSGKGKFSLEPIDINLLIQDTIQMLAISISKNVVMKYNYAPEPVFLDGDPSQIRQIIMNLVINASDAIGKKSGMVALTTGSMYCDREYIDGTGFETQTTRQEPLAEGMYLFLEVSDTGIGMSKEIITRIFEPFFTTKFTGRGLGLSAVLGIVGGHNGMVKIYSEESKGTTFKILFPLSTIASESKSLAFQNISNEIAWAGQGTFLIADDEEAVRTVGRHMLKKLGFEVLTAEDGRHAIEIFKEHKDDIIGVLLDLTMPHKDGAEVFREIRKINPKVKVILSSGYNEQDATQQFVGKGLAGFIQKPYASKDLVAKIKEVMGDDNT